MKKDTVKKVVDVLRELRLLKADELSPSVIRELDAVIQELDELSKRSTGKRVRPWRYYSKQILAILAKIALTIKSVDALIRMLGE